MDVRETRALLLGPGRRETATVASRSAARERSDNRQHTPAPVQGVGRETESRGASLSDVDTGDPCPWPVLVSRSSSLYSDRGSNIDDQSLHELTPGVCEW